jgi:hypothetical protein
MLVNEGADCVGQQPKMGLGQAVIGVVDKSFTKDKDGNDNHQHTKYGIFGEWLLLYWHGPSEKNSHTPSN